MGDRNLRKERVGVVTSDRMQNSIIVSEVRRVKHPKYGKFVLKTKKYVAHDQKNDCKIGDKVRIMEVKPMSKTKSWRLMQIIERAK
tara:strand:+ start:6433 stop:6690 length:258 start_codon:yes stop_codon:yes gene_type:complete